MISKKAAAAKPKSRFERSLIKNAEQQRASGQQARQRYAAQQLSDTRSVVPKTEDERARMWGAWVTYVRPRNLRAWLMLLTCGRRLITSPLFVPRLILKLFGSTYVRGSM